MGLIKKSSIITEAEELEQRKMLKPCFAIVAGAVIVLPLAVWCNSPTEDPVKDSGTNQEISIPENTHQ